MKWRHNRMLLVCSLISVLLPVLITVKDFFNRRNSEWGLDIPLEDWYLANVQIIVLLVVIVLSGVLITAMIQREYGERTIINQLTAPVSRGRFLLGKLTVWAIIHLFLVFLVFLGSLAGALLLYPGELTPVSLGIMAWSFLKAGILGFLTLTPVMAAALLQRTLFYPSLMICLTFVGISSMTMVMPGMLAFLLPWCASVVLALNPLSGGLLILSLSSIAVCGAAGIFIAAKAFQRQNI